MTKKGKPTTEEQVAEYIRHLDHPLKAVVQALRTIVLSASAEIGEQIKWNSLSFYYTGPMPDFDPKEYKRDLVVFNLHKKDRVLLVFPTGALINDKTGLLEGQFRDSRKTTTFTTLEEVHKKETALQTVLNAWLQAVHG